VIEYAQKNFLLFLQNRRSHQYGTEPLTHLNVHWLAGVHLAGSAPNHQTPIHIWSLRLILRNKKNHV